MCVKRWPAAAGGEQLAVARNGDGGHELRVAERVDDLAADRVTQAGGLVRAAGEESLAVGGKRDGVDGRQHPLERGTSLPVAASQRWAAVSLVCPVSTSFPSGEKATAILR